MRQPQHVVHSFEAAASDGASPSQWQVHWDVKRLIDANGLSSRTSFAADVVDWRNRDVGH